MLVRRMLFFFLRRRLASCPDVVRAGRTVGRKPRSASHACTFVLPRSSASSAMVLPCVHRGHRSHHVSTHAVGGRPGAAAAAGARGVRGAAAGGGSGAVRLACLQVLAMDGDALVLDETREHSHVLAHGGAEQHAFLVAQGAALLVGLLVAAPDVVRHLQVGRGGAVMSALLRLRLRAAAAARLAVASCTAEL